MELSNTELKLIAELLELAADEFGSHGCNDFILEPTAENKELICKIIEDNGDVEWEQDVKKIKKQKSEICFYDWWLMSYLAKRCKNLIKE